MEPGLKEQAETKTAAYFPIALDIIRLDETADFDLFILLKDQNKHILYREKHLPFTESEKKRMLENGVDTLYVQKEDYAAYLHYLENHLSAILDDPKLPVEQKGELLYTSLVGLIEDVMQNSRTALTVTRSRSIVQNTCKFLYAHRNSLEHMMRICKFDYNTYTHSINVFVFAMALGQRIFPRKTLMNDFGMGALLHDIGKSRIPPEILNFKGKLSEEQFAVMKKHPVYGDEMLKKAGAFPLLTFDMVRHHHERIKGGGYPDNLHGSQIRREVRVLTIADIFDALTTRRSYKDSMNSFPALKLMHEKMRDHIDTDIFKVFVQMMGQPKKR